MTITKRDPDSEFWQIVARGAKAAEGYPDWKRGASLEIAYGVPLIPERPKPTLMGLGQIRIPVYPIPVPRVALIDLSHFEPAPKVRTTITVPVTWAARVTLDRKGLSVDYVTTGDRCYEGQAPWEQGCVNDYTSWPTSWRDIPVVEARHAQWAAQARKQRGLT